MVRNIRQRHRIGLKDAAPTDFDPGAVQKRYRKIDPRPPILLRCVKGRLRERKHAHRADGTPGKPFGEKFIEDPPPGTEPQILREPHEPRPDARYRGAEGVDSGVDSGIDSQKRSLDLGQLLSGQRVAHRIFLGRSRASSFS